MAVLRGSVDVRPDRCPSGQHLHDIEQVFG